jgi:hypothetical protein
VELELSDGIDAFAAVLDFDKQEVRLLANGDPVPLRQAPFPPSMREPEFTVELSTFDRQVIVAIAGEPLLEPLLYPRRDTPRVPLHRPAQIAATGGDFRIQHLQLYRDVYYTPKGTAGQQPEGLQLADDEFFVLGDNSPVSVDSRLWDQPAVKREALIGKPLVVHLPSQPGAVQWGGQTRYLRIPDFSRIRYIR